MKKKYLALLIRYKKAIDKIYEISGSGDYTPDLMSYDYDGFDHIDTDENEYFNELKNAVNKAELYVKFLTHNYTYTFG
jgi:hypothetical protein|tara:strand:- start:299 stop:532 length:234 start_codon:yes stop_codon:yes gene_type:complete